MRTLTLIIMVLAFLVGGGSAGLLKVNIDSRTEGIDFALLDKTKKQMEDLKKEGVDVNAIQDEQIKQNAEILAKAPAKWQVDSAGILGMVVALLAFMMVVLAFIRKESVLKLSIVVFALSAVLWLICPDIEAGTFSGANPKSIATISLIALAVCCACAFMSYKLYLKKLHTTI